MSAKPAGTLSLVVVPAVVTFAVTVLRLLGEISGWSPKFFPTVGPGPDSDQGLIGITALIPVFGFWFGWRLRRQTGGPAHAGKAALGYLLGGVVLIGCFLGAKAAGLITLPSAEAPGVPTGLPWAAGCVAAGVIVMLVAWPRLSATLLLYAVFARLPVVLVTYLAVANDWGTHYEKLPQDFVLPDGVDKATFLCVPQVTFWPAVTVFAGGLAGCLAAALARRKA